MLERFDSFKLFLVTNVSSSLKLAEANMFDHFVNSAAHLVGKIRFDLPIHL